MRAYYLIPAALCIVLATGCNPENPFVPWLDADGYYTGWVDIDRPGMGFDDSFDATLSVWGGSVWAALYDDHGHTYSADHVDYDSFTNSLEIFFRVTTSRWSPDCGYEIFHWEMRMNGWLDPGDSYMGELEADIDPEDYQSDYCDMDYNPPPQRTGTFHFVQVY